MRIVLPLVTFDLERYLRLQRPTFERCYADLGSTLLITRPDDMSAIKQQVAHLDGIEIVDEREFVPEEVFRWDPRPSRRARRTARTSWEFQQLIKLAAIATLDDDFVLVLDGDVIAEYAVRDADHVAEGRALRPIEPIKYPLWIRNAARTLGVAPIDHQAAVTPSVLAPAAVRLLAEYVTTHVPVRGPRLRAAQFVPGLRRYARSWRGRLLGYNWTEYQLYDTFLVTTGQFEVFHRASVDPVFSGNEVHWIDHFIPWQPGVPGDGPRHFFSVVQSRAAIPIDDIAERLRAAALL
jgi:hypothetical protein